MKTEIKIKHLELIQGVTNRLANNSFLIKGWSVALVAASFALAAKDANVGYILVVYLPLLIFWLLDGYFLWQERLYRALYDHVRVAKNDQINFSMDVKKFCKESDNWLQATFSRTLLIFYLSLIGIMLIIMYFLK